MEWDYTPYGLTLNGTGNSIVVLSSGHATEPDGRARVAACRSSFCAYKGSFKWLCCKLT